MIFFDLVFAPDLNINEYIINTNITHVILISIVLNIKCIK